MYKKITLIILLAVSSLIPCSFAENFAHLKGKLPWPTAGKLLPLFGEKVDHSTLPWHGAFILAPENQVVHAIADGRVIFSDWLPKYGLLLIISHDHHYITVYGRNHSLYKKTGDWVKRGDPIATVGHTGGYEKPALYFEIRHNTEPMDPIEWLKRRE